MDHFSNSINTIKHRVVQKSLDINSPHNKLSDSEETSDVDLATLRADGYLLTEFSKSLRKQSLKHEKISLLNEESMLSSSKKGRYTNDTNLASEEETQKSSFVNVGGSNSAANNFTA